MTKPITPIERENRSQLLKQLGVNRKADREAIVNWPNDEHGIKFLMAVWMIGNKGVAIGER